MGTVGNIIGAREAKKASRQARSGMAANLQWLEDALDKQTDAYEAWKTQITEDVLPQYTQFEAEDQTRSTQMLRALMGVLGPEAQQQAYNDFVESPGTQYLREQGTRLADSGVRGGERLKALTEFGQNLASQEIGQYKAGIAGMAQMDQDLAGRIAGVHRGLAEGRLALGDVQAASFARRGEVAQNIGLTRAQGTQNTSQYRQDMFRSAMSDIASIAGMGTGFGDASGIAAAGAGNPASMAKFGAMA